MGFLGRESGNVWEGSKKRWRPRQHLLLRVSKFNGELQIYRQRKTLPPKAGSFSAELVQLLLRRVVFFSGTCRSFKNNGLA